MVKIAGKIKKGKGRGRIIGFPTANIELRDKLKSGVYGGRVKIENKNYKAGIFVSLDGKILEAHLIGFEGDLCGKEIEVEIGKKIREAMKFKNDEELRRQIMNDISRIINKL